MSMKSDAFIFSHAHGITGLAAEIRRNLNGAEYKDWITALLLEIDDFAGAICDAVTDGFSDET